MNRVKGVVFNKYLKKYKLEFYGGIIGLVIMAIFIFLGVNALNSTKKSAFDYNDVFEKEEVDVVSYLEINKLSDKVAKKKKTSNSTSNINISFYYASSGNKTYLVYLKDEDANRYLGKDLEKNPVKIYGHSAHLDDSVKANLDTTDEIRYNLPSKYFDGYSDISDDANGHFIVGILVFFYSVCMIALGLIGSKDIVKIINMFNDEELANLEKELDNYDDKKAKVMDVYFTSKYMVSFNHMLFICKYDDMESLFKGFDNGIKLIVLDKNGVRYTKNFITLEQRKYLIDRILEKNGTLPIEGPLD